jgi:hypothetical protein
MEISCCERKLKKVCEAVIKLNGMSSASHKTFAHTLYYANFNPKLVKKELV